jgi:hypothetical protein
MKFGNTDPYSNESKIQIYGKVHPITDHKCPEEE